MKKELLTGLLAIIMLSISLCSCGVTKKDNSNQVKIETGELGDIGAKNMAMFRVDSYDDYLKFLKKDSCSESFIGYDSLKQIGKFQSLVVPSIDSEDLSRVDYSFRDASGSTVVLSIIDLSKTESTIEKLKPYNPELEGFDSLTDLRSIEKDISGNITIEDVKYYYALGKLSYIRWQYNNFEFILSGTGTIFESYPLDVSGTFMSTLFYRETFKKSIDSLMEAIWG